MNKMKLIGKIAENGYTQKSLAEKLGMSENTLSSRINGKSSFNVNEVIALCDILNISDNAEKANIFLSSASQN